ncbi:MAG: hypothetical protein ACI8RZ_007270, partial [Myxococcota bacterium]
MLFPLILLACPAPTTPIDSGPADTDTDTDT